MLFPLHSDAPIYHYPITTVGLIVVNVLLFICWPPVDAEELFVQQVYQRLEQENRILENMTQIELDEVMLDEASKLSSDALHPDSRVLHFGNGLRPWQWVTANFMHADVIHLVGNMIFLWGLGLVIEGKLGWWRFLLVYLMIGSAGYGLVQVLMLNADGGNALGASLPIYGIMVLALLWAPLNELHCVLWFRGPMTIDVPIVWFALGYLVLQIGIFLLTGMEMGSEALHLLGAVVALPVGLVMLTAKLVDCEDYDAISVWRGRHEMSRDEKAKEKEASPEFQAKVAGQQATYLAQLQEIVDKQRDPALAWTVHQKMRHRFYDWMLPEQTLRSIIRQYHEQDKFEQSLPAMEEFLYRYPAQRTADIRLTMAQHMIRQAGRPRQGLLLLGKLDPAHLSSTQLIARDKLTALAEETKREIEIEEPCEDW